MPCTTNKKNKKNQIPERDITKKTKQKSQTALEKDLLVFLRGWFFALQNE
jgi:hypothetical protein